MPVTRLGITARQALLDSKPFGSTGPYEVLRGMVTFAVDPVHPCNRGKHRLLFEAVNRGRIRAFRVFDAVADTPDLTREAYIGDGFLLRQGYHELVTSV